MAARRTPSIFCWTGAILIFLRVSASLKACPDTILPFPPGSADLVCESEIEEKFYFWHFGQ